MPAQDDYDAGEVRRRLEPWFSERLLEPVRITGLDAPGESGFSSETMLVDLQRADGAVEHLVIKTRPLGFQVFPSYDMAMQYRCLEAVGRHSDVPVPTVRWYEPDSPVLDREFYVMDRVEGSVPADRPPYTIAGFLHDASPEDQSRAYFGGLDVLVGLHGIDVRAAGLDFLGRPADGPTGFEQQLAHYARFLSLATGDVEHPTLHPGLDWLRANRPEGLDEGLSWGDSRLGNLMFRDFEPVAVFDWEMAALGPREVDLAWYVFFVRFFSDHLGLPNLPGFPPEEEGLAYYEDRTGHTARHLDYFLSWAAFRWGVIWTRLMPQRDPGELPDDWTIDDNPATRSVAELMGLPEPRG